eukprot:5940268-Pleurochrysis_carterae.AAC.4
MTAHASVEAIARFKRAVSLKRSKSAKLACGSTAKGSARCPSRCTPPLSPALPPPVSSCACTLSWGIVSTSSWYSSPPVQSTVYANFLPSADGSKAEIPATVPRKDIPPAYGESSIARTALVSRSSSVGPAGTLAQAALRRSMIGRAPRFESVTRACSYPSRPPPRSSHCKGACVVWPFRSNFLSTLRCARCQPTSASKIPCA